MTMHSTCDAPREITIPTPPEQRPATADTDTATDTADGWDALALAELGRPLTPAEHALTRSLSVEDALGRLFPRLSDAARHEALWALA